MKSLLHRKQKTPMMLISDPSVHHYLTKFEQKLKDFISHADIPAQCIKDAILYSLFPGGKRLRPLIAYLCGDLLQLNQETLHWIAIAIELTHGYSLIHDDLPAMDNDDVRRNKPSCHRAFGEATAILAGDGMQALAIEALLNHLPKTLPETRVIAVTQALLKASGPSGMISGQSFDLSELAHSNIDESRLRTIHALKTGALILACINMPLAAANDVSSDASHALRQFAGHLGLVFQMQDDYLDRYANEKLGKGRSSDLANEKRTFSDLYSQETLNALIIDHFNQAQQALQCFGGRAQHFTQLMKSLQRIRSTDEN